MATITVLRDGVQNPEGPVSLPDGSWLFTEMDIGAISHVDADGSGYREIIRTGLANGLAVDSDGQIWVAEAMQRVLLRVSPLGEAHRVSTGSSKLPFLLPNDLCFGPDGAIYMTDSGILLEQLRAIPDPAAAYDLDFDGRVFRIDPTTGYCTLIDRGFRMTNGIAFGSGGHDLYVAETLTGDIYRYRIADGLPKGERKLFGNVMEKSPVEYGRIAGPDGMAFDVRGNLHVAVLVEGTITILDPAGRVIERVSLEGNLPTNLAFDQTGKRQMLITEASDNQLLLAETEFEGLPLVS